MAASACATLFACVTGGPVAGASDRAADVAAATARGSSCSYVAAERMLVARGAVLRFVRRGPALAVVDDARGGRLRCTGEPTLIERVERVRFRATRAIYQSAIVDLRGGRLAAGRDSIDFRLRFSNRTNADEGAAARVIGTRKAERLAVGRVSGRPEIDLDSKSSGDADVRVVVGPVPPRRGAPEIVIEGGRGADALGAVREGGFDGQLRPAMASLLLLGGRGSDLLVGGPGEDLVRGGAGLDMLVGGGGGDALSGGPGRDAILAGAGNDEVRAADGRRDGVHCGAGKRDRAVIDARDSNERCESTTIRRRAHR